MENILFVTVGNSDVQFKIQPDKVKSVINDKGFEQLYFVHNGLPEITIKKNRGNNDSYLIDLPRENGEKLNVNADLYLPYLDFPILKPVVGYLKEKKEIIDAICIVFTNQQDAEERYRKNDTVFFKELIKKWIIEEIPEIKVFEYAVLEKAFETDFQYTSFSTFLKSFDIEMYNQAFLLPQGGIDQINQSLTLQLIQLFKGKLTQLSVNEDGHVFTNQFPSLFLHDLTKKAVENQLNRFDFGAAAQLIMDKEPLKNLCIYLDLRLNMKHKDAFSFGLNNIKTLKPYLPDYEIDRFKMSWEKQVTDKEKGQVRIYDSICRAHHLVVQENYGEALIRLFTVFENLFALHLDKYFWPDFAILNLHKDKYRYKRELKKETWEQKINELDSCLISHLNAINIKTEEPNRWAFHAIYLYMKLNNKLDDGFDLSEMKIFIDLIEKLAGQRNSIAHNFGGMVKQDFDDLLDKYGFDTDSMFKILYSFCSGFNKNFYIEMKCKLLENSI